MSEEVEAEVKEMLRAILEEEEGLKVKSEAVFQR
jgi:hypothetical protein